jgi:CRISPR-associated protein Csm2
MAQYQQNSRQGQPQRNRQGQDYRQQPSQGTTRQLPEPKALTYYKDDEKKILDPELLDSKAGETALNCKDLKTTQMRRFYDDLKAIERKIMSGKDLQAQQANFERDRALIVMFKAKAVYAEKRRVAPPEFTQFIFDHVASIKDLNDFKAFIKVFESVVAFHKFYSPER